MGVSPMGSRHAALHIAAMVVVLCLPPCGPIDAAEVEGFQRGDCNADGSRNISDMVYLVGYLFESDPSPECLDACDTNDDGSLGLADAVHGLNTIFMGPLVFPEPDFCGVDPTQDSLSCEIGHCSLGSIVEERSFTLETGRIGLPYHGDLPANFQDELFWQISGPPTVYQTEIPYTEFGFTLDNYLPLGLTLDSATGVVTGSAAQAGVTNVEIWARHPNGDVVLYDVDVPVFSSGETEFVSGQDLTQQGSFIFGVINTSFDYQHQLPWPPPIPLYNCGNQTPPPPTFDETKNVQVLHPFAPAGDKLPIVFFHHGTGFDWGDYGDLLIHLATHGFICVTVNDQFSYFGYISYYCWGGHDEAARVMLATRDLIAGFDADPSHVLHERVDWTRVFYAGHSRGGGTAMVCAEMDRNTRGVIALQGTDVRLDSQVAYTNRWLPLPDVPILSVSAEQDADVIYPAAERVIERFSGPSTLVTVYGGCHGYATDDSDNGCNLCEWSENAPDLDTCRYVTRDLQHDLTKQFVTAFIKRYGFGDLSTENLLYGSEYQTSEYVNVAYFRNLAAPVVIDDFDDYPQNSLGGTITSANMVVIDKGSCHDTPFPIPPPLVPIANLVMVLPFSGTASFDSPLGSVADPLDVSGKKRFSFRLKNHDVRLVVDNFGFSWLDLSITFTDADGDTSTVVVDPFLPSVEFHPEPEPPTIQVRMKYQRFHTVTIPVTLITNLNPALDLDALTNMSWVWTVDGTQNLFPRIGLDDIRFE